MGFSQRRRRVCAKSLNGKNKKGTGSVEKISKHGAAAHTAPYSITHIKQQCWEVTFKTNNLAAGDVAKFITEKYKNLGSIPGNFRKGRKEEWRGAGREEEHQVWWPALGR